MQGKFIGGLILGAALALFFTSDTGKEVIGSIADTAEDLKDKAASLLRQAQGFAEEAVGKVKKTVS